LLQLLQAYGNNSHSRDGRPVYFVLEGNVNPRDAEERGLSLVYPNPQPSNFSYARKGTPHWGHARAYSDT